MSDHSGNQERPPVTDPDSGNREEPQADEPTQEQPELIRGYARGAVLFLPGGDGKARWIWREGEGVVWQMRVPCCGWGDLDDDQFHGRVSILCACGIFHETRNIADELGLVECACSESKVFDLLVGGHRCLGCGRVYRMHFEVPHRGSP